MDSAFSHLPVRVYLFLSKFIFDVSARKQQVPVHSTDVFCLT